MKTCAACNTQHRDSEFESDNILCRECAALAALGLSERYPRVGGYNKGQKLVNEQQESRAALLEYDRQERERMRRAEPQADDYKPLPPLVLPYWNKGDGRTYKWSTW